MRQFTLLERLLLDFLKRFALLLRTFATEADGIVAKGLKTQDETAGEMPVCGG